MPDRNWREEEKTDRYDRQGVSEISDASAGQVRTSPDSEVPKPAKSFDSVQDAIEDARRRNPVHGRAQPYVPSWVEAQFGRIPPRPPSP